MHYSNTDCVDALALLVDFSQRTCKSNDMRANCRNGIISPVVNGRVSLSRKGTTHRCYDGIISIIMKARCRFNNKNFWSLGSRHTGSFGWMFNRSSGQHHLAISYCSVRSYQQAWNNHKAACVQIIIILIMHTRERGCL